MFLASPCTLILAQTTRELAGVSLDTQLVTRRCICWARMEWERPRRLVSGTTHFKFLSVKTWYLEGERQLLGQTTESGAHSIRQLPAGPASVSGLFIASVQCKCTVGAGRVPGTCSTLLTTVATNMSGQQELQHLRVLQGSSEKWGWAQRQGLESSLCLGQNLTESETQQLSVFYKVSSLYLS